MKKFALESVLSYRSKVKERLEREMAAVEIALEGEEAKLSSYLELERNYRNELETVQSRGAEIDQLALYYSYIRRLKKMQEGQRAVVEQRRRERDAKRVEVLKAHQDKKILEKLKQKQEALYRAEEQKISQTVMDEKGVRSYWLTKIK